MGINKNNQMNLNILKKYFILSTYFVVALSLFWIFLKNPGFSLVDDGYSLLKGKALIENVSLENWKNNLVEVNVGRFRPIYLIYYGLIFSIFGTNPVGLWLGEFTVVWITMVLIYLLLKTITKNDVISFLMPFIWLAMPTFASNVFRLGTAEPRQLLFSLSSFYIFLHYLKNKKITYLHLSILFFIFAIGTKETSILLLPVYLFLYLNKKLKKYSKLLIFFLTIIAMSMLFWASYLLVLSLLPDGYAVNNIDLNLIQILKRLKDARLSYSRYYWFIWLNGLSFILRLLIFWFLKLKDYFTLNQHQLSLFLFLFGSIFFVLAWGFGFERYYYLTWTAIVLVSGIEISSWLKILKNKLFSKLQYSHLLVLVIILILILRIGYEHIFQKKVLNIFLVIQESREIYKKSFDAYQLSNSVIKLLLVDRNIERLYVLNDNYEVIYELGLYASQLNERNIEVINSNKEMSSQFDGYYFSENPYDDYKSDNQKNSLLVGRESDIKKSYNLINRQLLVPHQKYSNFDSSHFWWVLDNFKETSQ